MDEVNFRKNVVDILIGIFEQLERANELRAKEIGLLEETQNIVSRGARLAERGLHK